MQFGTMNLFPLDLAYQRLKGYYLSADLTVYSTRRGLTPVKMSGSKAFGAYHRNYTLNGVSYTETYLRGLVGGNSAFKKSFAEHTSAPKVAAAVEAKSKVSNRSHAQAVDQGIKSRGFVIAQVAMHDGQEHLLFGSKPAIHMTEQSYKDEMTRLATSKPGMKFVALKIVASVVSGGVKWE